MCLRQHRTSLLRGSFFCSVQGSTSMRTVNSRVAMDTHQWLAYRSLVSNPVTEVLLQESICEIQSKGWVRQGLGQHQGAVGKMWVDWRQEAGPVCPNPQTKQLVLLREQRLLRLCFRSCLWDSSNWLAHGFQEPERRHRKFNPPKRSRTWHGHALERIGPLQPVRTKWVPLTPRNVARSLAAFTVARQVRKLR